MGLSPRKEKEEKEVEEEEILAYLSRYGYLDADDIKGVDENNGVVLMADSEATAAAEPAAAEDDAVAEASTSVADGEVRSRAGGAGVGRSSHLPHQVLRILRI